MTVFFQKPIKAKQATVRVCKVFDKGNTVISTTTSTLGEVMLGKMKFTIKDGEEFDVVFQDIDLRLSSKDFFTKENSVKKNVTDKRK